MPLNPVEIFISYSHKDKALVGELLSQLALMQRQGTIKAWHDGVITAGADWKKAIDLSLSNAAVILLCISSDFLASEYCWGKEMRYALSKHKAGKVTVIPVLLRAC